MNIPNEEECEKILKKFEVPDNILRHSRLVEKIALFLAKKLIEKGEKVDLELIRAAAILHDIDKIKTKETGNHGKLAYDFLKEKYPEVAEVIISHLFHRSAIVPLDSWEKKLVYYADCRVNDDKLVSFEERVNYIVEKYGNISEEANKRIHDAIPFAKEIEKEIFKNLDIEPEDLKDYIK